MKVDVYLEGGGDAKDLKIRCQRAFHQLFAKLKLGRSPAIIACGSRENAFGRFMKALSKAPTDTFVVLLVDSEDPVGDSEKPWDHLKIRDHWDRPGGAEDDQALLMQTCMETWIAADREMLVRYYKGDLHVGRLPPLKDIEERRRHEILRMLERATEDCSRPYSKGVTSFLLMAEVSPDALSSLKSFSRVRRILLHKLRR